MGKIHDLKINANDFHEIFMGHKNFDVRKNDRNFQKGDVIIYNEWDCNTKQYTGNKLARNLISILNNDLGYITIKIN